MFQKHQNNLYLLLFLLLFSFLFILINLFFNSNIISENNSDLNIENKGRIFGLKNKKEIESLKEESQIKKNIKKRRAISNTNFGVKYYYVSRNKNGNNKNNYYYYFNNEAKKKQKFKKYSLLSIITAKNTNKCPNKLDAVTEGYNKRLYLFSGEIVYEVFRDIYGLQQRQAYLIRELFPNGPRQVTAVLSNQKNGITLLIAWRSVYRYRWNKKNKRFYMAKNSPRELPFNITFVPRIGFQWNRGHLILANKNRFAIYDPYWNLAPFVSKEAVNYFPNLALEKLVGVLKYNKDSMLWMTKEGKILLYDLHKHKIGIEMPINLSKFIACLLSPNSTIGNFGL
ncbi:unnamed protein product [Meloidogyne enterolobii]|uniref:Uncharacterized protein n=1 Tax=Meloidogyne enterolobii TaxID=390850 RepID=A0ACB0XY01_MELEN